MRIAQDTANACRMRNKRYNLLEVLCKTHVEIYSSKGEWFWSHIITIKYFYIWLLFAVSSRIELLHYLLFETIYKTSNCLHNLPAQAHSVRFAYFQVHIRFVILTAKTIYIYIHSPNLSFQLLIMHHMWQFSSPKRTTTEIIMTTQFTLRIDATFCRIS